MARREHSKKELQRKLRLRGVDSDIASQVLGELEGDDLLSETRYTSSYIESRHARGFGPLRIQKELGERGIGEDQISQSMAELAIDWQLQVKSVYRKKYGSDGLSDFNERARRARFLQYRGFTGDQIRHVFGDEFD